MKTFLIKFVASKLAGIGGSGFDKVVAWVIEQSEKEISGLEKAEEVIGLFNEVWGDVAGFISRTVVQLAYAYARIKGDIVK